VFSRKPSIFLFLLCTPIIVGELLSLIVGVQESLHGDGVQDFPIFNITTTPRCRNGRDFREGVDEPCISIGYSIIGDTSDIDDPKYARYHQMMGHVAEYNEMQPGKDVKPITAGKSKDINSYFEAHPNSTQYMVVFCHEFWSEKIEYLSLH